MYGLSLDQAPPYKLPILFYMTGVFYLILLGIILLFEGLHVSSRYDSMAIAITHLLTLGFFMHVMMGSLFQIVPVIISQAYKNVSLQAKLLYIFLNLGIFGFISYFLTDNYFFLAPAIFFLVPALLYFAFYSFVTIIKTEDKNATVKTFLTALLLLVLGSVFGLGVLLERSGDLISVSFVALHLSFMLYGWLFLLFSGVAYKIFPMFYVASEYPKWIKNSFYIFITLTLLFMIVATFFNLSLCVELATDFLALLVFIFAITSINILKKRKRARSDITIKLFYFVNANLALSSVLFFCSSICDLQLDFAIGIVFGLGFAYTLINAMLYKIVPFLTWFHLSSSLIYEAEMSEVIGAKMMRLQAYIFFTSYIFFLFALYRPLLVVASVLFTVSSVFLLYNLFSAYGYHQRMAKL